MADVLILPGGRYGPELPLLHYAARAAEARGGVVESAHWRQGTELRGLPAEQRMDWVESQVRPHLQGIGLLLGKSLGTYGARLAAEHRLPAVWLTPILTNATVVAAMSAATAPMLLVGGTADSMWDGTVARKLSPHVLEVDGADHGMDVPGRLAASVEVLGRVATAVEDFLDEIGYSGQAHRG